MRMEMYMTTVGVGILVTLLIQCLCKYLGISFIPCLILSCLVCGLGVAPVSCRIWLGK